MEKKNVKIVVLGQTNVGSTSLIERYVNNIFHERKPTGNMFLFKKIKLNNNKEINVNLWDNACNEISGKLKPIKILFKDLDGIALVYDVTNESTLEDLNILLQNIKEDISNKIPIILIGNKIDSDKIKVTTEKGKEFADKNGIYSFYEVSAKENINVKESFECLIQKAYNF